MEKKKEKSKAEDAPKGDAKGTKKAVKEAPVKLSEDNTCGDINCPIHGALKTRGMVLDGIVVSDKMQGSVIVERESLVKLKKYERYKRHRSRIPAHNPACIKAKTGDKVRIRECRRLSKTVSFVVTEKLS